MPPATAGEQIHHARDLPVQAQIRGADVGVAEVETAMQPASCDLVRTPVVVIPLTAYCARPAAPRPKRRGPAGA